MSSMTTKTHPLLSPHTHRLRPSSTPLPLPWSASQPLSATGTSPLKLVHEFLSPIAYVDFPNSRPTTTTVALAAGVSKSSVTSSATPMIASSHESQPVPKQTAFPFPSRNHVRSRNGSSNPSRMSNHNCIRSPICSLSHGRQFNASIQAYREGPCLRPSPLLYTHLNTAELRIWPVGSLVPSSVWAWGMEVAPECLLCEPTNLLHLSIHVSQDIRYSQDLSYPLTLACIAHAHQVFLHTMSEVKLSKFCFALQVRVGLQHDSWAHLMRTIQLCSYSLSPLSLCRHSSFSTRGRVDLAAGLCNRDT
jgi:hypothetical protein